MLLRSLRPLRLPSAATSNTNLSAFRFYLVGLTVYNCFFVLTWDASAFQIFQPLGYIMYICGVLAFAKDLSQRRGPVSRLEPFPAVDGRVCQPLRVSDAVTTQLTGACDT